MSAGDLDLTISPEGWFSTTTITAASWFDRSLMDATAVVAAASITFASMASVATATVDITSDAAATFASITSQATTTVDIAAAADTTFDAMTSLGTFEAFIEWVADVTFGDMLGTAALQYRRPTNKLTDQGTIVQANRAAVTIRANRGGVHHG